MAMDKAYREIIDKLNRILAIVDPQPTGAVTSDGATESGARGHDSTEAPPWPGYDGLNVAEVLDLLKGKDEGTRAAALAYERANKQRATVIDALAG